VRAQRLLLFRCKIRVRRRGRCRSMKNRITAWCLQNNHARLQLMVPGFWTAHCCIQHDLPYLYVTLGPRTIVNGIVGKPELHQVCRTGSSFTHQDILRTLCGRLWDGVRNIASSWCVPRDTKNLCKDVIPGGAQLPGTAADCGEQEREKRAPEVVADEDVPYFLRAMKFALSA